MWRYPSGAGLPSVLVQAAPFFGQEIQNTNDQLAAYAASVATYLGRLVQRVPLDATPEKVPCTLFTYTATGDGEKLVVHDIGTMDLEALCTHRSQIPKESIACLLNAIIGAIGEAQNSLTNRIQLTATLRGFADSIDDEVAETAFQMLAPYASGEVAAPPGFIAAGLSKNPLSRFRITGGTPSELTAISLYTLACLEQAKPGRFGSRLDPVVEESLSHDDAEIRKAAFAAVREIPKLAACTWLPVLLGTRDPDFKDLGLDSL